MRWNVVRAVGRYKVTTHADMLPPGAPLGENLYNSSETMEFPTMMMEEVVFLEGPQRDEV